MVAVSELVSGLDADLVRLGYQASTMAWYQGCCRRLERVLRIPWGARVFAGCHDGLGRSGLPADSSIRNRPAPPEPRDQSPPGLCAALDRCCLPHQRNGPALHITQRCS
jgi:hypothetical protein